MLHVLLIAEDTSSFINRSFYYLENELKKMIKLSIWRKSGHINDILKRLDQRPHFILIINDMGTRLKPIIRGLAQVDIPTGLVVTDVHRLTKWREAYIAKHQIQHLFAVGRDQTIQTYPHLQHRIEWLPHFVKPEIFHDYSLEKNISMLMIGAVNDYYPLRKNIMEAFSENLLFTYYPHPGYRNFNSEEENSKLVGERYAREINQAKLFFTCPSIFNYPVMKYFEVLACRTVLLAPTFQELEDLGFIPGKHFVAIDSKNVREKAAYYLTNPKESEKIADEGYRFIHENHTLHIRAQQLINQIKQILES